MPEYYTMQDGSRYILPQNLPQLSVSHQGRNITSIDSKDYDTAQSFGEAAISMAQLDYDDVDENDTGCRLSPCCMDACRIRLHTIINGDATIQDNLCECCMQAIRNLEFALALIPKKDWMALKEMMQGITVEQYCQLHHCRHQRYYATAIRLKKKYPFFDRQNCYVNECKKRKRAINTDKAVPWIIPKNKLYGKKGTKYG